MGVMESVKRIATKALGLGASSSQGYSGFGRTMGSNQTVVTSRFRTPQQQQDAYSQVSWVYSCVSLIASTLAMTGYKITNSAGKEVASPFADLLLNPNSLMSSYELLEGISSYLELNGNAYLYLSEINGRGQPREIYLLNPACTYPAVGKQGLVGYVFDDGKGQAVPLLAEEVMHIKYWSPRSPFIGMGTVEAAASVLDNEAAMSDYNRAFFSNGARPSGVLSTDGMVSDDQFNSLKEQWQSLYGGVRNMGKTAVLEAGMTYQPMSMSQADMMLVEQRKASRDEILAMFGVPGTKLGLLEYAGYKAEEADKTFWNETMRPRIARIEAKLNQLAGRYGVRIDFEQPNLKDQLREAQIAELLAKFGVLSDNELRGMLGFEPTPAGDVVYKPSTFVAAYSLAAGADTIDSDGLITGGGKRLEAGRKAADGQTPLATTAERRLAAYFAAQAGRVNDRLARTKEILELVPDADAQGLADALLPLYNAAAHEAYMMAADETGVAISFDLDNPRLKDVLATLADRVTGMIEETRARIGDVVAEGLGAGWSISDYSKAITAAFDVMSKGRAATIARTETQVAYNSASLAAYHDAGVTHAKLLDGDGDERCAARDGRIITLEEAQQISRSTHPNCVLAVAPVLEVAR